MGILRKSPCTPTVTSSYYISLNTSYCSWGESAGAISVSLHMLTNGGDANGLFRGAFMQSGAPLPVGDHGVGQKAYDAIVAGTGCSGALDTLSCLRKVSYGAFKAAVANTPYIFSYQVSLSIRRPEGTVAHQFTLYTSR